MANTTSRWEARQPEWLPPLPTFSWPNFRHFFFKITPPAHTMATFYWWYLNPSTHWHRELKHFSHTSTHLIPQSSTFSRHMIHQSILWTGYNSKSNHGFQQYPPLQICTSPTLPWSFCEYIESVRTEQTLGSKVCARLSSEPIVTKHPLRTTRFDRGSTHQQHKQARPTNPTTFPTPVLRLMPHSTMKWN